MIINRFKFNRLKGYNPLFFTFLLPFLTDRVLTLVGQYPSYWHGYKIVNEGDPIGYLLLSIHPGAFIIESIVEIVVWYALVKVLPKPVNLILSLFSLLYSTNEGSTWIAGLTARYFLTSFNFSYQTAIESGYSLVTIYFLIVAVIAGLFLYRYLQSDNT